MQAEVKITVEPAAQDVLRSAFSFGDRVERSVAFFDTPTRTLHARGVVVRARWVKGKKDDVTVKLRGVDPGAPVPAGAEVEVDVVGGKRTLSLSVESVVDGDDAKAAAAGARPVSSLLTDAQRALLGDVDLTTLAPVGPFATTVEKSRAVPGIAGPVTLEVWRMDASELIVEVSTRCAEADIDETVKRLEGALAGVGVARAREQGMKTARALAAPQKR